MSDSSTTPTDTDLTETPAPVATQGLTQPAQPAHAPPKPPWYRTPVAAVAGVLLVAAISFGLGMRVGGIVGPGRTLGRAAAMQSRQAPQQGMQQAPQGRGMRQAPPQGEDAQTPQDGGMQPPDGELDQ